MLSFNHRTYTNLLRESSELAKKYRIDCGLEKKDSNKGDIESEKKEKDIITPKEEKDTVKTKIIEKKEEKVVEEDIEDVIEETKEYTIEDLREKLKNANVKFFNGAKSEKLIELCIENNLL